VKELSSTTQLRLAAGAVLLLVVAAVIAAVHVVPNVMLTGNRASGAPFDIARWMPGMRGPEGRQIIREIDGMVQRNGDSEPVMREALSTYYAFRMGEKVARTGSRYLARADAGKLRPKPSPESIAWEAFVTGMAYAEIGDDARALQYSERALNVFPNDPRYLNNVGYFLAEQGKDLPRALALTRRAVHLSPQDASFLDSYGWSLYMSGKYAEALKQLTGAAGREPNDADVRYHLGATYVKLNRLDEARVELKKSLAIENMRPARALLKSIGS
jgi:Flp pilus assembly protein TadD